MRDAKGHFVKGDTETAKVGGHALQRQIADLRNENDRLRAGLVLIRAALELPDAEKQIRAILEGLEGRQT